MTDDAITEEGRNAMEGAIDELIGDDEVARFVLFFQRSDCGNRDDALDAKFLQRIDIGAEVQFRWKDAMTAPMAGEEGYLAAIEVAEDEGVAGVAKRC